jgi:hypothetical protein
MIRARSEQQCGKQPSGSFRDGPKDQTSNAQLRIGQSRDSPICKCTS